MQIVVQSNMSDLGSPQDSNVTDSLPTIADVSLDAIASRVNPNQIPSGVTRGIQQLGSDKVYSDGGNNQIIVADTVPRVVMGNQPTFGEGFYVSKADIDATTNTDPNNWIFNSSQNVYKIVKTIPISLDVVVPSSTLSGYGSVTVEHSLTFEPAYEARISIDPALSSFTSSTGLNYNSPAIAFYAVSQKTQILSIAQVSVDGTFVNFEAQISGGITAGTYHFSASVDLKQQTFGSS